jgi:hypothetical protein
LQQLLDLFSGTETERAWPHEQVKAHRREYFSVWPVMSNSHNRRHLMNAFDGTVDRDEALLTVDLSDQAVEAAAGSLSAKSATATLAFCSGLDTCPSVSA